jgi:valyl-tRNA synthetase
MPFITEEIWQIIPHYGESIFVEPYTKTESISIEDKAYEEIMEGIISIIKEIRTIKSELNIPPTQQLKASLKTITPGYADLIRSEGEADIRRLAGLSEFTAAPSMAIPLDAWNKITSAGELFVVIKGVDLLKQLKQVEKRLATANAEFELEDQKWKDPEFQKKAPPDVKAKNNLRRNELSEEVFKLSEHCRLIKKLLGEKSS